jgi:hypothetical protein
MIAAGHVPEKIDTKSGFWEVRYLLTSNRWTARLPRNAAIALPLTIPFILAYGLLLGGPRTLGDFQLLWQVGFVALPSVVAIAMFARPGRWLIKVLVYALVLTTTTVATVCRYGSSLQVPEHFHAWNLGMDWPHFGFPPTVESAMLDARYKTRAIHHASEEHYLKWGLNDEERHLAEVLSWRVSDEAQARLVQELTDNDEYWWSELHELVRVYYLPAGHQRAYWSAVAEWYFHAVINPEVVFEDLRAPCLTPEMFDEVQAIRLPNLRDMDVPDSIHVSGSETLNAGDLDRLAEVSPCYYEFLLAWHPQVRQSVGIIGRLHNAGLLLDEDVKCLQRLVTPDDFARMRPVSAHWMSERTGKWREYLEIHGCNHMLRLGEASLQLSPDEFCRFMCQADCSVIVWLMPFVAYEASTFYGALRRQTIPRDKIVEFSLNIAPPAQEAAAWLEPHLGTDTELDRAYDLLVGKLSRAAAYEYLSEAGPMFPAIVLSHNDSDRRSRIAREAPMFLPRLEKGLADGWPFYLGASFLLVALAMSLVKMPTAAPKDIAA